ncbi:MAG: hypothetical protein K6E51_11815 [Treponema sp.]|nr:hypothetical protein [Treponema sp.]
MKEHYKRMIADSEKKVALALRNQITDPENEYCGGFLNENGLVEAKIAIYEITTMTAVYCNKESTLYHSEQVKNSILAGLTYIRSVQHDNGLFDYIDCNFFSAPDTAFCIKRLLAAYLYLHAHLQEYERDGFERLIHDRMGVIIEQGAEGMVNGGFHTPNHRWAIASNLLVCASLFNRPEFAKRAQDYLNEGIDCNSDGEYAEKSAGNYNRINNDAMITIGDCTGDTSYYDNAIRNLRMMLTYFEPNGSIFTANSTRQDNGKLVYPIDYYMEYLRMGHDFKIPEFLDMANKIFDTIECNRLTAPDFLIHIMNRPDLIEVEHDGLYQQPDFAAFYKDSGIARVHEKDCTWTVMQGKSNFLYVTNKSIVLEVKVAGSFCEHRAFISESMDARDDKKSYTLEQTMKGWYYLPFETKPETTDWWKMDNTKRPKLHGPNLNVKVTVTEARDADGYGVDLHVVTSGVKPAPFRIEIACTGAERVVGDQFEIPADTGSGMIAKTGMITFENKNEHISIGPAFAAHRYTAGKFGSEQASNRCFTLYFTDYVPFDRIIKIRS